MPRPGRAPIALEHRLDIRGWAHAGGIAVVELARVPFWSRGRALESEWRAGAFLDSKA
jgi:hypothetical protein